MTENNKPNLEELLAIQSIKIELWQTFDIIRNEPISSSDYYIILFLLTLKREGLLDGMKSVNQEFIKKQISVSISKIKGDRKHDFIQFYNVFESVLNKIRDQTLSDLLNFLDKLNPKILDKYFPQIFDDLLYKFIQTQGRFGGEYILPLELSRFICGLAELPQNGTVYNPFAGLASFGVFLAKEQKYLGQEIILTTWAIGSLRIMAYEGSSGPKLYLSGDSINNWNPNSEKYDLIIANPPFGMRFPQNVRGEFGNIRTYEHFFIEKGIEDLKVNGKLIAVISANFLFHSGPQQNLRRHLVENDLLELVISFPGGLLSNTGIPFTVLVINKKKKEKGIVRFIDSKRFVDLEIYKRLDDHGLSKILFSKIESESIRIVSNSQIKEFNYNLNVPRFFVPKLDIDSKENLENLGDLVSLVRGTRDNEGHQGRFIRIRNLKDDKIDNQLDLELITKVNIPRPAQKISEACLLLAMRWKTLKPTYFKYSGESIYIIPDTIALKIDETKVDINYLINELHADYVLVQIESFRFGTVIPYIRREDLLKVKVQIPSLEEQKAKVLGYKEAAAKLQILEAERNAMAHGFGNILYENSASIKHSLGKPLMNIGSSVRNIERALSKLNKEWEFIKISEKLDVTLKESFVSVYSNLELIHSLLKKNERDFNVENYKLSDLDFLKFVKDFVKRVKSSEKSNVDVKIDINPELVKNFNKKLLIIGNRELLEIALNNIVENANMHAFTDSSIYYKLEFRISLYMEASTKANTAHTTGLFQSLIKVEIANNGVPFPKNFTFEKFVRRNSFAGPTGNTGFGGYDINEIVKYHEGKFHLITENPTDEFVTKYVIFLPINSSN